MSEDKLNSIKQQTKLEINKLNKLVNDYKIKEKDLDTEYKKKEENLNKNLQEKQKKLNAKLNKRDARKIKKIKKKTTKTLSTQTDTIKVEMKSMNIQTESLKPVSQDFTIIKETIQTSIDKFLTPNISEMSTQCNFVEQQTGPKQIIVQKSVNEDFDFYLLNFFRRMEKENKGVKYVKHIDINTETKCRRDMLCAIDTNENIYKMSFTAQYSGDIRLRLYSGQEELLLINYTHKHKASNHFRVHSRKYRKQLTGILKKVNMNFREFYKIELEGKGDNKFMIKFNGKDIVEVQLDQQIKFFTSNSNFKMIYN